MLNVRFNARRGRREKADLFPLIPTNEKESIIMAENNRGDLTINITADVDEAVTGLKRLQRELRETTKAVRELESAYKGLNSAVEAF